MPLRAHLPLRARLPPLALGAAATLFFFGHFLGPDTLLAVRDVPIFHLPLRSTFAQLARSGVPWWNPLVHGGQPILSNPNYAAFYPPTWLALLLPPHQALGLLVAGHAAAGFAGAWRLARHLGCARPAATLAALGFAGSGAFVSAANTVGLFCGLAWLPWVILWGDRAMAGTSGPRNGLLSEAATLDLGQSAAGGGRGRGSAWCAVCWTAAGIAAQVLAGEPAAALLGGLAVLCLATGRPRAAAVGRATAALMLAALLAAAQIVPTASRLAGSARAAGVTAATASWSLAPARLIETVYPRFYGDAARSGDNLYFGWGIHDSDYPYLISIHGGLLPLVLAAAALLLWPIPRRAAWAAMILVGLLLALGRHNPAYVHLLGRLPPFSLVRYPEKFLLLATTALPFAAALGWQHVLDRRRAGERGTADLPAALAAIAAAVAGALGLLLAVRPAVGPWFVDRHVLLPLSDRLLARGAAFLREEAAVACALAAAAAAVLLLARLRRVPARALTLALLAVLAADLAWNGRSFNATASARAVLTPPPLASALPAGHGRIFVASDLEPQVEVSLPDPRRGPPALWPLLERFETYSGNLWGFGYALQHDYDWMATPPAARTYALLRREWPHPVRATRLLGAWGVTHVVRQQPLGPYLERRARGEEAAAARLEANPYALPIYRFAPVVVFHAGVEGAEAALRADAFDLRRREHWIGAPPPGEGALRRSALDTRLEDLDAEGATIRFSYRAGGPTFFVAAVTYDRGWRATTAGGEVPVYQTAAGQMGLALPAGGGEVVLRYRDPSVCAGAALSAAAALLVAGIAWRARWRVGRI